MTLRSFNCWKDVKNKHCCWQPRIKIVGFCTATFYFVSRAITIPNTTIKHPRHPTIVAKAFKYLIITLHCDINNNMNISTTYTLYHFTIATLVQESGRNQHETNENVIVLQIVQEWYYSTIQMPLKYYTRLWSARFSPRFRSVFNLFEFFSRLHCSL